MLQKEYLRMGGMKVVDPLSVRIPALHTDTSDCNHILIIDDSNQTCSSLVTGIVRGCADSGRTCQIIQSGPFGLIETVPMNFSRDVFDSNFVIVYTASSPRDALRVLRLPNLKRLTLICDIMMPNDTQVGLVGLLRELTELKLPVNLLFASGEGQNRQYVEELLKNRKAYFVEKGSVYWGDLPFALVQKSDLFRFQVVVRSDYDKGRLPLAGATLRTVTGTNNLPPVIDPFHAPVPLAAPVAREAAPVAAAATPATALAVLEPPVQVEAPAELPQPPVQQIPARPRLKTSTGLLSLLTFWRRWVST